MAGKQNRGQKMIAKTIFSLVFIIVACYAGLYYHELAHVRIENNYGCEKTRIEFGIAEANVKCYSERLYDSPDRILAHSINEIVGYNLMMVVAVMIVMFYSNMFFNTRADKDE